MLVLPACLQQCLLALPAYLPACRLPASCPPPVHACLACLLASVVRMSACQLSVLPSHLCLRACPPACSSACLPWLPPCQPVVCLPAVLLPSYHCMRSCLPCLLTCQRCQPCQHVRLPAIRPSQPPLFACMPACLTYTKRRSIKRAQ